MHERRPAQGDECEDDDERQEHVSYAGLPARLVGAHASIVPDVAARG
jgi:hypothetical protein